MSKLIAVASSLAVLAPGRRLEFTLKKAQSEVKCQELRMAVAKATGLRVEDLRNASFECLLAMLSPEERERQEREELRERERQQCQETRMAVAKYLDIPVEELQETSAACLLGMLPEGEVPPPPSVFRQDPLVSPAKPNQLAVTTLDYQQPLPHAAQIAAQSSASRVKNITRNSTTAAVPPIVSPGAGSLSPVAAALRTAQDQCSLDPATTETLIQLHAVAARSADTWKEIFTPSSSLTGELFGGSHGNCKNGLNVMHVGMERRHSWAISEPSVAVWINTHGGDGVETSVETLLGGSGTTKSYHITMDNSKIDEFVNSPGGALQEFKDSIHILSMHAMTCICGGPRGAARGSFCGGFKICKARVSLESIVNLLAPGGFYASTWNEEEESGGAPLKSASAIVAAARDLAAHKGFAERIAVNLYVQGFGQEGEQRELVQSGGVKHRGEIAQFRKVVENEKEFFAESLGEDLPNNMRIHYVGPPKDATRMVFDVKPQFLLTIVKKKA